MKSFRWTTWEVWPVAAAETQRPAVIPASVLHADVFVGDFLKAHDCNATVEEVEEYIKSLRDGNKGYFDEY